MWNSGLADPTEFPLWHENLAAKKGWKQGDESAVLEPDRKCKAEDEGGEQKGPFLHFHNLVGFMSKEKLITWDKSLARAYAGRG